ncbi:MAG: cation/multidrug efflux pump [Gammaproteobacteria bacterium]|nr:MAG: cation/multidrug efflux pump [Gammaproteobacteria bacterium]
MLYTLVALVIILIAVYIAYSAIKVLWLNTWFIGWLKGMFGLCLLALGVGVGLVAYDVYTYKQINVGQPVATINFEGIEDQYFDALIVSADGKQQRFSLHGDQWQLDTRIIKWQGYFASLNIKPAFRLDRLSGRYYDIHKETTEKRSNFLIVKSLLGLDVWQLIHENQKYVQVLEANYGTARYLPMKSGALYEISLSNTGLNVRPLNDVAAKAIEEWK